jgi:hypothetical protein
MKHILPPFLPFFPGTEVLRELPWLYVILDWVYWISILAILVGFRFKQFSLVLGILVVLVIIGSKIQFSNSFLFSACFLILIGVYRPGFEWIFRVQLSLVYLGAGINKLFDPDWQSGQYFEFFLTEVYSNSISNFLTEFFQGHYLFKFFSWITITLELLFGFWVLTNRKLLLWFLLVQFFHLSMLVLTGGELSYIFFFLIGTTSYLILFNSIFLKSEAGSRSFFRQLAFAHSVFSDKKNARDGEVFKKKYFPGCFHLIFCQLFTQPLYFGLWIVSITSLCMYRNQILNLFNSFSWNH